MLEVIRKIFVRLRWRLHDAVRRGEGQMARSRFCIALIMTFLPDQPCRQSVAIRSACLSRQISHGNGNDIHRAFWSYTLASGGLNRSFGISAMAAISTIRSGSYRLDTSTVVVTGKGSAK